MNVHPVNLVFMLEEESARHFLDQLLPEIIPECITYQLIPHHGKSDLQDSIPTKLKAWRAPNTFFIILHDLDNHQDCKVLKKELQDLCMGSRYNPLIRIVCQELEAWYCGDLDAVEKAFPRFKAGQYKRKAKFRDPDAIVKPGKHLEKIVKGFAKGKAARTVPQYMDISSNTSSSFNHTITGIQNLVAAQMNKQGD